MILDGHIHVMGREENRDEFLRRLRAGGVDGGILISLPPKAIPVAGETPPPRERLDNLLRWTEASELLFPFFWIDPTEADAAEQVRMAADTGAAGFKVICSAHDPGEPHAMETYRAIATAGRPILFHSGILWDGTPSSRHNRPANFECLLEVDGLRFSLAHISWPWVDECIAVYGKFLAALRRRKDLNVEMFIDTTRGTPPIYRRDALTKLFTVGYDVAGNVVFGTDGRANAYSAEGASRSVRQDDEILQSIGVDEATRRKVFSENLLRFVKGT